MGIGGAAAGLCGGSPIGVFPQVGCTIAICVRFSRVDSLSDFIAVIDPVSVGVRVCRIRVCCKLLSIGQSIRVGICEAVGNIRIGAVGNFPGVR